MTEQEFQKQYHEYQTFVKAEAEAEAEKVNAEAVGFSAEVIELPPCGWCLVTKAAGDELKRIFPELVWNNGATTKWNQGRKQTKN